MDQKEIDALLNGGSTQELENKQEEILRRSAAPAGGVVRKEGHVIGQLSKVSEESEAGTNMVMNYLENVVSVIAKIKNYQKNVEARYDADPASLDVRAVFHFTSDTLFLIEDLIFNAMDAFQFQDINRQKLMKVMHTLAKLNEYLNELLGTEGNKESAFGHDIDKVGMQRDRKKEDIDQLIDTFSHPENVQKFPDVP